MKPSDASPHRIGSPTRSPESHGRTDGLTKTPITLSDRVAVPNVREEDDPISTLGQTIDSISALGIGERHPVIRSGERVEIPTHVRHAVWFRDNGKCESCGTAVDGVWHLDHITPWSAGGSDDTTNLRVLCERHNMERGNRVDWNERRKRAATWWCYRCEDRVTYINRVPFCETHDADGGSPGRCRLMRHLSRERQATGEWPVWHMDPVGGPEVIAYCAHCHAPGLTRWVL